MNFLFLPVVEADISYYVRRENMAKYFAVCRFGEHLSIARPNSAQTDSILPKHFLPRVRTYHRILFLCMQITDIYVYISLREHVAFMIGSASSFLLESVKYYWSILNIRENYRWYPIDIVEKKEYCEL